MDRRVKLAFLFVGAIFAVLIASKGVRLVRDSVWDGRRHINIAVDNGDLHIWSIEPRGKGISLMIVPQNTQLSLPSYGEYKAQALSRLSLLERKDGSLFQEAIVRTFALPTDGVVLRRETKESLDLSRLFGFNLFSQILSSRPFDGRLTNLTLYDLFRLWLFSFNLRKEAIEVLDLKDSHVLTPIALPDQTQAFLVEKDQFSELALEHFKDRTVEEERLAIEIHNGTSVLGEANFLATLLTNIGGNVINTVKVEETKETRVFARKKSYTASKIAKLTSGKLVIEAPREGRADILVILGTRGD